MALWALAQSLRGCEWLPAPARTLVGAAAFGWGAFWRASRRRDLSQAPEPAAGQTLNRVEAVAGGVMSLLRPLEERYYAAGAVILAVAIVYIFAR